MSPRINVDKTAINGVRKALAVLSELQPALEAAERAGFDLGEEIARFHHYKKLAESILATYEPILLKVNPAPDA